MPIARGSPGALSRRRRGQCADRSGTRAAVARSPYARWPAAFQSLLLDCRSARGPVAAGSWPSPGSWQAA
eukprot:9819362-Alexandrium_andersonii.AAC.1